MNFFPAKKMPKFCWFFEELSSRRSHILGRNFKIEKQKKLGKLIDIIGEALLNKITIKPKSI
jgi:hypothetical protein